MNEDSKDEVVYAQPDYTQPFSQPFAQQQADVPSNGAQETSLSPEPIGSVQDQFNTEPAIVNPDTQPYTQQPPYMGSPYVQPPFDQYYGQPYFGQPPSFCALVNFLFQLVHIQNAEFGEFLCSAKEYIYPRREVVDKPKFLDNH